MSFVRNIHFTLLVRINNRLHEFNFRKRNEELYDGDTSDDRGNRFYFKAIKSESNWEIQGNNLPDWIKSNDNLISEELTKKENF